MLLKVLETVNVEMYFILHSTNGYDRGRITDIGGNVQKKKKKPKSLVIKELQCR